MRAARPRALLALAVVFQLLFFASLFAGLGAPLLWEDEAETAMHGRSVLEYSVPRVHVGRNVVYGASLPLDLGRLDGLDAYLGSPWGQYFFAAPAVAWSDRASDLATRTWRLRVPFVVAGWLGVLLLGVAGARLWPAGAGSRAWFWLGFGACLVVSISLQLHLREVRYYPLVVFALGVIAQLELRHHLHGDLPSLRRALLLAPALFVLFNLFYPAFSAVTATACGALLLVTWCSHARWPARAASVLRAVSPYALAWAAALPLVALFGLPAQTRSFFETFGREGAAFAHQLASAAHYLFRYEFGLPAALGAAALVAARWQLGPTAREVRPAIAVTGLVLALTAIWVLLIARTPLFFSRYLVALSPLLSAICVLEAGCLVALRRTAAARVASAGLAALAIAAIGSAVARAPELRGRIAELREPYRGPLDHVIPYLEAHYPSPADLVIATNYEEFTFMFYLRATTTFGYYAPERGRDLAFVPDVIVPRPWPVNKRALQYLASQGTYVAHGFPVANTRVNNLPDLSPRNQSGLVHRFRSPEPERDGETLVIGERQQP
jgi:hypothetical protein